MNTAKFITNRTGPVKWYDVWIFIPAVVYFVLVYRYAVNKPYYDDFYVILRFLNEYNHASLADKINMMFAQQNEHRILASRIIFVLYYKIFGHINFRGLIFIGNAQLLAIFLILVYFIKKCLPQHWKLLSFIMACCVFDATNFDNALWAMAAISNYGIILYFLLSILFYSLRNRYYVLPAILFQVLTIYSNGNGIIASFILVIYILFTKDRIKILACSLTFLATTILYFVFYKAPDNGWDTYFYFNKIFHFFFSLAGSHFDTYHPFISQAFGIVLIIIALYLGYYFLIKKFNYNAIPILCMLCFIILTMVIIACYRINDPAVSYHTSRYLAYPHIFSGLLMVLIMIRIQSMNSWKFIYIPMVLIMTMLYVRNLRNGKAGFAQRQDLMNDKAYYYPHLPKVVVITDQSCKEGIYCYDK